jgi:hypothetical protein
MKINTFVGTHRAVSKQSLSFLWAVPVTGRWKNNNTRPAFFKLRAQITPEHRKYFNHLGQVWFGHISPPSPLAETYNTKQLSQKVGAFLLGIRFEFCLRKIANNEKKIGSLELLQVWQAVEESSKMKGKQLVMVMPEDWYRRGRTKDSTTMLILMRLWQATRELPQSQEEHSAHKKWRKISSFDDVGRTYMT